MNNGALFLDDIREPIHAYEYTKYVPFVSRQWDVVRSFDEFVGYIGRHGVPEFISFDHDLADSHYTPEHYWNDYQASKLWQEKQVHTEKTGYDCARWLVDHCYEHGIRLPGYFCHSMNPVGKDKILSLLDTYAKVHDKD